MDTKTIAIVAIVLFIAVGAGAYVFMGGNKGGQARPDAGSPKPGGEAKEFSMTSYYEMVDGKPKTAFSLKEMQVKKGDRVRVKITNTKGAHDFVIDEYNVRIETPLNQEVVAEFVADKAGDFIYYCSKPNHREWGQWGTLRVTG
ncbi:MAG: hypothetical protein HYX24_03780 [Candidatus Aenigmarchaeota archaeon]|nr:hypothetical protein [Candidatus Aenigmarchaeota archaeon]